MNGDVEHVKLNPDDFGGIQTRLLTAEEAKHRYCVRRFCHDKGRVQIPIPGEGLRAWRVLCARHFIMLMVIQAHVLGDPSPVAEGRRLAESMGVPPELIPDVDVPQIADMNRVVCGKCGGGMIVETAGMFRGKRFVHTCPEADEQGN